jgi:pyruvate/2-oxoglutarate dehydrogenase complex dihydrolipoamide acyltransferase (E2) component
MAVDKYAARLADMKKQFTKANEQAKVLSGDESFPAGEYIGKITAKLKESKAGNLMVSRMFVPTEGELQGLPCWDNVIIEHDNLDVSLRGQRTCCRFLDICGYSFNVDQPGDLPAILEALTEEAPIVKFRVRVSEAADGSRSFTNCDVLSLVESGTGEADAPAEEAPAEAEAEAEAEEAPAEETADRVELTDFAIANGIEGVEQDDTVDVLKERIREYSFPSERLTDDEKALLEKHGLTVDCVIEPPKAAPKPAPAKKAAPAPAKAPASKKR